MESGAPSSHVVVLGAGLAGLSAADKLIAAGHGVTVLEASAAAGGAHRSHEIGSYTFDVGSIFYEDKAQLFELAPGLKQKAPVVKRVQRRIGPAGGLLHYPVEPREIMAWPIARRMCAIADMLGARIGQRRDGTLRAICLQRLGCTLFAGTGLENYIDRFHHIGADQLDEEFFFSRMGFIDKATRPRAMLHATLRALQRKPYRVGPPSTLRVRPSEGFAPMFGQIVSDLQARGIAFRFSSPLTKIVPEAGGFLLHTEQGDVVRAGRVVSTIPLDRLYRAVFGASSGLQSLDLMTLFVSARQLHENAGNVLFNFHAQGRWKRITVYSRLYPDRRGDREFFSVEITLPPCAVPDPEAGFADLQAHLDSLGIASDLRLEGHEIVDCAYPLYFPGYQDTLSVRLAEVRQFGITTVGRQGRLEYLPTSSGVIRRVHEELVHADLTPATPHPRSRP